MKSFSSWKVSTKLATGFGLLIVLLLCISGVSTYRIAHINESLNRILDDRLVKVNAATDLDQAINMQVRNLRGAVIGMEAPEELKYSLSRVEKGEKAAQVALAQLKRMVVGPKGLALLQPIEKELLNFDLAKNESLKLVQNGQKQEAGQYLLKHVRGPQNNALAAIDAMIAYQSDALTQEGIAAKADGATAIQTTVALALIAVVAALIVATLITRSLTRQLGGEPLEVVRVANAIAQGDLTVAIDKQRHESDSV
eukprot:gene15770-15587_t